LRKLSYVAFKCPSPRLLLKRLRNRHQVAHIADELRSLPGRPLAGDNGRRPDAQLQCGYAEKKMDETKRGVLETRNSSTSTIPSLQNFLLYLTTFLIEVARLMREELVLNGDPVYRDYAARVRYRLLPGIF
jgi:hypothetical protein